MKNCLHCKSPVSDKKKKSAVYCSDLCRYQARNAARTGRCDSCRIEHPSVKAEGQICTHCQFFNLVKMEKAALDERISWCRDKSICIYCGETAQEKEHVVPQCSGMATYIVPSCKECNSLAGGKVFAGILEKHEYIQAKRRKRYGKILKMPEWEEEELKELGMTLRSSVRSAVRLSQIVKAQLGWNILTDVEHEQ